MRAALLLLAGGEAGWAEPPEERRTIVPSPSTAALALAYAELENPAVSQCETLERIGFQASDREQEALVAWSSAKIQSNCPNSEAAWERDVKAQLHLGRPQHAYRAWRHRFEGTEGEEESIQARGLRLAIADGLGETPYAGFAPPGFEPPSPPWNSDRIRRLSWIPGAGQAYLGQWGSCAHYLAVNAAFAAWVGWRAYTAYALFRREDRGERKLAVAAALDIGWLAGLIWPRYWRGSGQEALREAEKRNRDWYRVQMVGHLAEAEANLNRN
jgi:hypothetical protein